MKNIDMNKEYRYGHGGKATILFTNRPNKHGWCVISMDEDGNVFYHQADGRESHRVSETEFDLFEVSPYDYLNNGDVVEIEYENGLKMIRRWKGVDNENKPLVYSELASFNYSFCPVLDGFNITLIARKNEYPKV